MYCKNCGAEIPDDSKFCFKCGIKADILLNESKNEEIKFKQELNDLRNLITSKNTDKIPILLDSVVDTKENGEIFMLNYSIEFHSDLVGDLIKLSNSYDSIKRYVQKFIDFEIIENQYPHNRIGKIVQSQFRKPELEKDQKKGQFSFIWKALLGIIVLIVVFRTCSDSTNDATPDKTRVYQDEPTHAKIGDQIDVEHFVYRVNKIRFRKSLGNEFSRQTADGIYLIVDLSLKNLDNVEHTLDNSMFKLTDENGTEFESSTEATTALLMSGKETLFLKQCNPQIQKQGFLVFEVPFQAVYNLHLSGGFWTGRTAVVKLKTD